MNDLRKTDFLVIGGSAAGTTAAETIRNLLSDATITIVSDEPYEQYSRVLTPHYVRHKVLREQVFLKKPDWYLDKKIELVKGVKAQSLDSQEKKVKLSNGEEIGYGKLLIAVGGYVIPLKVPGADLANVLYLRTIDDADRIIEEAKSAKSAVIVGGGFIGLEFASCFKLNGISDVTLLVREPYYWAGKLDEVSSRVLVGVLQNQGIKIVTEEEVEKIEGGQVVTKSGNKYGADVIGVGIGIKPDFGWLDGSGVEYGRGIKTNEYLETNVADVYAAGDCAEFYDVVFERQHIMGNWANATSQGAVVGKNMAHSASSGRVGEKTIFGTASSYSINFFDGSCSFIGVTDADFADNIIVRGSVPDGKITSIFIKKMNDLIRVVGATVINNPADVGPLTMVIKNKVDILAKLGDLKKPDFDLKTLIQ